MVVPERLRDVLLRGGEARELQVDVAVVGLGVPQRQQHTSGALVIVLERQRPGEREHVLLVATISNGGSAERLDCLVDMTSLNRLLAASEPLGGVPKAHLAVACRDGSREEEGRNRNDDERA